MKYWKVATDYCGGVDLHWDNMYLCIVDRHGEKHVHRKLRNREETFRRVIQPYAHSLTIAVESTGTWYWLADLCHELGIPFLLGHAVYMKWVHGTKAKNDRIDSEKIARNTIGGYLPKAYPYPRELRATRDLLRRRSRFVSMRTGVLTHIKTLNAQVNLPPLGRVNRTPDKRITIPSRFSDPDVAMSAEVDATTADYFDSAIHQVERHVLRRTKEYKSKDLSLLMTVPGIGKILGLTIALEIHNIDRFDTRQDFCAYSRLIRSPHTSNDKKVGWAGRKIGNPYLKWAFSETVFHAIHSRPEINAYWQKMLKKREPGAAQAVLAHKFGRAIYYMLKRGTVFDEEQFLKGR